MNGAKTGILIRFWQWWTRSLGDFFFPLPPVGARRYPKRIILSVEQDRVQAFQESASGVRHLASVETKRLASSDGTGPNEISEIAEQVGQNVRRVPVGIRFDASSCLDRKIQLPRAAEHEIDQILRLEIERSTPFSRQDIYTANYVSQAASAEVGQVTVHHLILKRSLLDPVLEALSKFSIAPRFVDCWNEDQTVGLPVDFLESAQHRHDRRTSQMRLAALAGLGATVALIVAATATVLRHQSALESVEQEVAKLSETAKGIRQETEKSHAISSRVSYLNTLKRERMASALVLEKVTALLPDTVWLTDFHLDDRTLDVSGYANAASGLISRFERADNFEDASLSAPVVLDPGKDRERFSLRALLKTRSLSPELSAPETNSTGGQ